ncbi:MAG: ribosomal RNA small subunit methyltransferase A [Planctomycetes bacterium]|nr:ribosomal RNA small subunit methyltransferase A [Planctomycetota bacterium]
MSVKRHGRRLDQLKDMFERHGIRPSIRRGQNFLLDKNQVSYIARVGDLGLDDIVLEVGPGTGFLSKEIIQYGCRLFCVELDNKLADLVKEEMAEHSNFELMKADILAGKNNVNPAVLERVRELVLEHGGNPRLKTVSNLPYSAGTPFVMNLFHSDLPWVKAVFLIQLEVGERMTAKPGSPDYGTLSIACTLGGNTTIERKVPPQVFWPRPKVASAVVSIEFNSLEERMKIPWRALRRITSAIFSSRRKLLRNSLKGVFPGDSLDEAIEGVGLDPQGRGELLLPEEFLRLAEKLAEMEEKSEK